MIIRRILLFLILFVNIVISAQGILEKPFKITGFAEVYYQYDSNNPVNNSRPNFIYSHHRNNEININLAFIKANYETENLRANLALATGTYMNANYSEEQGVLKNIYEANIGFKISKNKNSWIDAGVFPSHIGFESAAVKDNWTLTRSISAENSPYFETGAKISYTTNNGKWFLSGLILNGWQRIQQVDGNSLPSFGHQLSFTPNEKLTFNSSSFIGNDKPDSIRQMRYFHNLYGIYKINNRWAIRAGFDLGADQKFKGSNAYNIWYTPVLIAKYSPTGKISIAARSEYYNDKNGAKIITGTENGFQMLGYSLNFDYQIFSNLLWRTEIRNLNNRDAIFLSRNTALEKSSFTAVSSLSVGF